MDQSAGNNGSSTIVIENLEHFAEPSFVLSLFGSFSDVEEIECPRHNGSGIAYVTLATETAAHNAVRDLDMSYSRVQGRKLRVSISDSHVVGQDNSLLRLSDFLRAEKEEAELRTSTVRILNLPMNHTRRSLNLLLDDFETHFQDGELYDEMPSVKVLDNEYGTAFVQFGDEHTAVAFVRQYNGTYWKNATIYAKCVPDNTFKDTGTDQKSGKNVGLWVGNLKVGFTAEDIRYIFDPFVLQDISIPTHTPSKDGSIPITYAFVFMTETDAAAFQALHPEGLKAGGRWIKVRLSSGKKGKGKTTAPPTPLPDSVEELNKNTKSLSLNDTAKSLPPTPATLPKGPTDVRIGNLPYSATKTHLRDLFKDFNVTKVVSKSSSGYGFVGLVSRDEANRACQRLSGKKVLGRTVTVAIADPVPAKKYSN